MPLRKLLAYGAIYILWGGSFLAIRELVAGPPGHTIPPFFAAGFRFSLAGAILILWSRIGASRRDESGSGHGVTPRRLLGACALGFIMFTCQYAALFWAETRVASGIAAVVSATIPVWIFAGEVLALRTQRVTRLTLAGILLGFGGVAILALCVPAGAAHTSAVAVVIMVAGTLCWSGGTIASRRLELPRPQQANAGWQMFSGGLLLLALSAAVGDFHRLPPPAILLSARMLGSMAYLVVAASIVAYSAYVWLLTHDAPTRVASYAYVNPVIALIAGAVLASERLAPVQIGGAALVVAGVFATLRGKQKAAPPRTQP